VSKIEDAITTACDAVTQRAQFIEFRVDYASDVANWSVEAFQKLVNSVRVPTILTMRLQSEGGQQAIEETQRVEILRKCIKAKPAFVDLEVRMHKDHLMELYSLAQEHHVGQIYSMHNFQGTPNDIQAETLLNQIKSRCPGLNKGESPNSVIKLVFFARCHRDNLVVLDLCRNLTQEKRKAICFCMGEKGVYSRVMCVKFGALFSYASIVQSTAPGQVTIQEFYAIFEESTAGTYVIPQEVDPACEPK
jgi:3-dehydroquinate dehydratase type I